MNDDELREKLAHLNDKIEDNQDRIREVEITLHGKRAKTGLLAEYERHDSLLSRLYAVIWQDPTGKTGLLHDVDVLMDRRKDKIQGAQYRWQFWGLILATLISSGLALLSNLDKVVKFLPKYHPGPLEQKIDQAKHPRGKKLYRVRLIKEEPSDSTPETPQNPQK